MELVNKRDLQRVLDRFEAWWLCENDTPLAQMRAYDPHEPCERPYATQEEAWFDFEGRIEDFERACGYTHFLADSLPAFNPNLGPDLLSTLWGAPMSFAPDTSWVSPIVGSCEEVLALEPDFSSPLWQEVVRFTDMSLERGQGKWLTMFHDLHPNADIPSALMGPEKFCIQFADDLDLARRAIEHVTPPSVEAYEVLQSRIAATGQATLSWLPAPHQGRMYIPQCDFSAMISTDMFVEAVLPSILAELKGTDRAIYHLDGPTALRHLDVLLEIPEIHAIQWVYGAGNGPALRWAHVYERIQQAGKAIQILAESPEDATGLMRTLKPQGVLFSMSFSMPVDESAAFLSSLGVPTAAAGTLYP